MSKMKVGVMEGINNIVIREMDIPKPGPNEVLVKIYQSNICTTDWQTWKGLRKSQGRQFPWAPGHEMCGDIVEVGENVRPELKVGMRVGFSTQGTRGCGECVYCRYGHPSRCMNKPPEMELEGVTGSFGMSQYLCYESSRVYRLSDDLPYEEGCFLEPVATSVHGVKRLRVRPGDKVLIIGAGNLGIINAQVARCYGGEVLVSEVAEERRKLAESLGFPTVNPQEPNFKDVIMDFSDGRGMDAIILSVGHTAANQQAMENVAVMGRILFFSAGYPAPEVHVDPNTLHYKEYELIGTFGSDPADYLVAAQFLSNRDVEVCKLISHKVPIDEIERAFELAATPGNYRVSISMW